MASSDQGLFAELKRRNVFRVMIAYVAVAWVVLQAADVLFPALSLPDWSIRLVAALLILGFPVAMFLAWAFELTPDGLKRDADVERVERPPSTQTRKLNLAIVGILTVSAALFGLNRFVLQPAPALSDRSIAVLPFVNMSSDNEQDYFSDGLSEELLNLLARVPELRVIGRTSSFQFKGKNEDLRIIGEKLNVSHILEGSVRKSENTLRITAQLIGSHDGAHIWSNTYQRNLDDIFKIQDEIAGSVVDALKLELLGESISPSNHSTRAAAYDLYLKGLRHSNLRGIDNLKKAQEFLSQALDIDPELALAWKQVATVYSGQIIAGVVAPEQGMPQMHEAIKRALQLDPMMASAHRVLGFIRMHFEWDWHAAETAFERALEIDPNNASTLSSMSLLAAALGHSEKAVSYSQRSLRVDPLNLSAMHNLGFVYYLGRDYDLAETALRSALEYAGGSYVHGHTVLALTLLAQGKLEEALVENAKNSMAPFRLASEAIIYAALGDDAESEASLATLIEKFGDRLAVPISGSFGYRGDNDEAMKWLNRAYQQHDAQLMYSGVHPMHDKIRTDPRFQELLAKLNLR